MEEYKRGIGGLVEYYWDKYEAVVDAETLLLVMKWKEFRVPRKY